MHDFELFKRNLNQIPFGAFILADKGYQGIYVLYPNSLLPLKAKRHCKLDPELKIYNQEINKRRIGIEHVFGSLKTFKILAERYRNRGVIPPKNYSGYRRMKHTVKTKTF